MRQLHPIFAGSGSWLALVLVVVGWPTMFAAGEESTHAYRRILVPSDAPSTWSARGEKLLPIEASDFDAWVADADAPPTDADIDEAVYEVKLLDDRLVDGHGSWQVVLRGERPARLSIGDTSLRIRDAHWRGDSPSPARLGWWPDGDAGSLRYALDVPRSGELEFNWNAVANSAAGDELQFPLHLPTAARTRLIVEVPAGRQPVLNSGIVLKSPPRPEDGGQWLFALPPSAKSVLRFEVVGQTTAPRSPTATLRQELHYVVSKRGIDLEAQLRLNATGSANDELKVSLPSGMQLISASVGEEALKWQVSTGNLDDKVRRATIQLPALASRQSTTVTLRTWSPLVVDERIRLPLLPVDDAFWSAGTLELRLDPALELRELAPIECVQTAAEVSQTPNEQVQTMRFAAFSPSAAVDLSLAHRQARGKLRIGTALEVGNPGIVGRLVAEVTVVQGSVQKLVAELRPGWSVDAVETVPTSALGEWYVEQLPDKQEFVLQLDRAVTADQPVKVLMNARLPGALALEPLPLDNLIPLAWSDLVVERDLLQLRAAEQYELQAVGPLQSIAASELTTADSELIPKPSDGLLFDPTANATDAAIRLAPKKSDYDAEIQLETSLSQGRLRQTYHIDCRPKGSGIDHVLVYITEPPSEPLRWTEASSQEPLLAERMPANDPRLGGLPAGGELWRLDLRRLYARPISIDASWSAAWPERKRVPLISLPDAAAQQGRISVSSFGNELPAIVARDMSPTPLPMTPPPTPSGANESPSAAAHAVYRFQPTRFYDAAPTPELWLGPPLDDRAETQLLATHVDVESRIAADGSGVHRVTYHFENRGANTVQLTLPPDVQIEAARVDGRPVPAAERNAVSIPLPMPQANMQLELELSSRRPPHANADFLPSPLPSGSFTILAGRWQIQLPDEMMVIDEAMSAGETTLDWRERLFGPLARRRNESPFNPFVARDWNLLWADLSRLVSTPAEAAVESAGGELIAPPGWNTYQVGFVGMPPAGVAIAHVTSTSAAMLAIFLCCASGATLFGLRKHSLLLLAAVFAAIGILVSAATSPLATGATLGFLAAALWRWMRQWLGVGRLAKVLTVLLAVGVTASSTAAAPPTEVERVLVPVDSAGKHVGTKYFVDADFLRGLISGRAQETQDSWLVTDMHCDGQLVTQTHRKSDVAHRWVLTLELDVLARDTIVRLPLVKQQAEWPAVASLDGMPAAIDWDPSGQSCTIRIAEPGQRRLSISFLPHVEHDADRRQIELRFPPVIGATLRIVCPTGWSDVQCNGLDCSRHDEQDRSVWEGCLDASGLFSIEWTAATGETPSAALRRVDELLKLNIAGDGITLDARYKLQNASDWPATIDVAVDDGWELMSGDTVRARSVPESFPDGRMLLRLRTASVVDDDGQMMLRFRAHDRSPVGRLRLPTSGLQSLPLENRVLAVTWDPALECIPAQTDSTAAVSPAEFTSAWPMAVQLTPQLIVSPARLDAAWYLAVRPRSDLSSCRDQLSLAAGKNRIRVDYRSEVNPSAADCFGWSLNVPADLEVQSIAITADGESVPLDWVRELPTRLHIYYRESVAKEFELEVVAILPMDSSGRVPLPRISPAGQPRVAQTIALYRDEEVLASCQFPDGSPGVESGTNPSSPFGAETRFVRAMAIDSSAAGAVEIVVVPNRPTVQGETLTSVSRDNGIWTATLSGELRVEQGDLDVLRLELPANWTGPFDVMPTATTRIDAPRNTGEPATLSIHLSRSVPRGDAVKLLVHSPLTLAEGELPSVPRIEIQTPGELTNYLALPKSLDEEQAAWTRVGIEPSALPASLKTVTANSEVVETFRISADSMSVALRPRDVRTTSARVRLAETVAHRDAKGGEFSLTRFIIAPAGLTQCVIALPEGERMVQATLDGHAALVRALDERHSQVQLGPPNLPQTLDVVTRATDLSERVRAEPDRASLLSSRRFQLSRPTLEQLGRPIPVDLGLWTLCQTQLNGTTSVAGGASVTPAELAATRLDRLANISLSATRSVVELPLIDGYSWFVRWAAGLNAAENVASSLKRSAENAAETIRVPQQPDDSVPQSISRSDAWAEQIAEIFAAAGMAVAPLEPVATATFDPWLGMQSGEHCAACFISDGHQDHLVVEWVPDGITAGETRFAALASLAALSLAAFWLIRKPAALELVENWREAVGVVLGIAAWAWLRPSGAGLVVAGLCLFLLLRRLHLERKSPRHDSTIQPSSIPKEMA